MEDQFVWDNNIQYVARSDYKLILLQHADWDLNAQLPPL